MSKMGSNNVNATVDSNAQIKELQKWFRENERLPREIDLLLLRRFNQCMFGNMEDVKRVILINYSLRNKYRNIFLDRDPLDEDSRRTNDYADMVILPGMTKENYKISLFRLCDYDPNKVHHMEDTKMMFMMTDCRFILPDLATNADALSVGEIQVFDMAGYTMKHLAKLSVRALRIYIKFLQDAFPVRLKAIHMINCPTYLDKILVVVRPFISTEVFKLIHFHTDGLKGLYEHIPQDMLPNEYGGKAGKMSDMKATMLRILEEKREYLMDPNYWEVESTGDGPTGWKLWF